MMKSSWPKGRWNLLRQLARRVGCLALLYSLFLFSSRVLLATEKPLPRLASGQLSGAEIINPAILWTKRDNRPSLHISLVSLLTAQQKDLVNSGFSTFSQIAIFPDTGAVPKERDEKKSGKMIQPLWQIACSVKFDTWEERYEVVRLEKEAKPEQVRDFDLYSQRCLSLTATEGDILTELSRSGGRLRAVLLLDQIAADQAAQIKDWLVKQQSGIIQGLFAHMLGDMKLSERGEFFITIPPAGRDLGQIGAH